MGKEDPGSDAPDTAAETKREGMEERFAFGILLRQRRLHRGWTLSEMAQAVKVPEHYLEALEDGDYDALPPQPYVKGFLAAYAAQLSLDPEEVWQGFEESFRAFSRPAGEEGRAIFAIFRPQGERSHWRDWTVPIVLAAVAGAYLVGRVFVKGPEEAGLHPSPPAAEDVLPAPQEMEIVRTGSGRTPPSSHAGADESYGVRLLLRAESSSWIAAERDGGPLQEWTLEEGETRTIAARKQIVLSLGNAGALKLNVNGRELGFVGHKGEVKRNLLFTAEEE